MTEVFLNYFDQARFIFGLLAASFLFCIHTFMPRKRFKIILSVGIVVCSAYTIIWEQMLNYVMADTTRLHISGYMYIILCGLIQVCIIYGCFEISASQAAFRCILGRAAEGIVTVIIKYLIVLMHFPHLPQEHFIWYLFVLVLIYVIIYGCIYIFVAKKMQQGILPTLTKRENTRMTIGYITIYIGFMLAYAALQSVCEFILLPLENYLNLADVLIYIRYLLILVLLVLCVLILFLLTLVYAGGVLRNERDVFDRLVKEKKEQYEFIQENVNMINDKCHMIRKQLRALEHTEQPQQKEILEQVRHAVNFYDAIIKTGNEELDTMLTQKSMMCAKLGIKLSCIVTIEEFHNMDTVAIYTILDTALENAIYAVNKLANPDKKVISVMLTLIGEMLYITVENYYMDIWEREHIPKMRISSYKKPSITAIKTIALRYGGSVQVTRENQIFFLQVLLPLDSEL